MKWLIILSLIFTSWIVQGHQPDVSSTMLVEQKAGSWVLQVRASLTAFQHEVRNQYGADAYDTPEKFQELVVKHLMENISINSNLQDIAVLENAYVKLGHETNVVFEVLVVPKTITSLSVKNSSFKNIHRNQSALVVLKKGFTQEQFVLNNNNQHTVALKVSDSKFELLAPGQKQNQYLLLIFAGVLFGLLTMYFVFKKRKKVVLNPALLNA